MIDYIVVGFGLAGLSVVEQLERHTKSVHVFENYSQKSSRVAGGLYNPVILKRFTAAWDAREQLQKAIPFYRNIERKLQEKFIYDLAILRRFNSVEEQNLWFEACDKPILRQFLSATLYQNHNTALDIPFAYGKVKYTGRIAIQEMLGCYLNYLDQKGCLSQEVFEYDRIEVQNDCIRYKGLQAKNIIFTEGFGIKRNPFFNYLPVVGNKGEYIIIKCEQLQLNEAVKSSIFIIPLGEHLYKVGATYNHQDKSSKTTTSARIEIVKKLRTFLNVDFEIVAQVAGIRPTVKDRRPLAGTHPHYRNLHVLNGLGSRGILIGPATAENLYHHIEHGATLPKEIAIKRYETNSNKF
ncbi:FAD-binding oxidoreductase [Aquimarina sp. U1-2]|uniref:NAD(P)/FAD-dependent oxidoreductase n=1 Tax=Aquimarina sp. U1-2 TaxID=2823141 RepID=UPI001AEC863E|nr:FAD-dependent oxidoreductase [Aquimarina sp. U1-2]MBP2831666.1 FAD-binding oxidoreductase [Aquimarina sp. U1-2]